ncbi:MAG: glutathione S-transferase [Alphaproteobacteria bacterium]|nr:glutathione S-transferase [Alphaproteobacteria bacterium]
MKLRYSMTSPYVRKVVVTAAEKGLSDKIKLVPTNTRDANSGLEKDNPLGKVPALITDDGESLYDSPVICEYLDGQAKGRRLIPARGPKRFKVLKLQALGDGMLDAAVAVMMEKRFRPPEKLHQPDIDRQMGKITNGLDALDAMIAAKELGRAPTIGSIAVGCALGYLDFRFPDLKWRRGRPKLTRWFKGFAKRPSMAGSEPKDA